MAYNILFSPILYYVIAQSLYDIGGTCMFTLMHMAELLTQLRNNHKDATRVKAFLDMLCTPQRKGNFR